MNARISSVVAFVIAALLSLLGSARPTHADWPQFRGDNSAGVADCEVPIQFGPGRNELWSIPLESGHSSPCVMGDSIFVTTYKPDERKLEVVSINPKDGSIRWRRQVRAEKIEKGHPSFNPASSSPASDGERVVAYFGSFGLICFDWNGEKLWDVEMPLTKSYAGNATSPMIAGDKVILYRGNHVDHFMLAVNKETGEQVWRVDQEEPFQSELACTAVPIVHGDTLIAHTARSVQAFDIDTGEQRWVAKCATTATSSPIIVGDSVVVAAWNKMGEPALRPEFPTHEELVAEHDKDDDKLISRDEFPRLFIFHRPDGAEAPQNGAPVSFRSGDKNGNGEIEADEWAKLVEGLDDFRARYESHGMLAIPLDSKGDVTSEQIRTLAEQGIPEVPSPLHRDGILYFVKNGGVLTCIDVDSGKRLSRTRTKGRGTHYASPIIAADKMYCTAGNGLISVLSLGKKPKVLAVNNMQDGTYATPAVDNGTLYVRTHSKLYAFRNP